MDLGFLTIDAFDLSSGLSAPATRIRRLTDGDHWSASNPAFVETKALGVSGAKSDYDYNYKTDFQIWKENKEFERQNILMTRPPLESTPIGAITSNLKLSHLDSTPVGTKMSDLKPPTRPTESSKRKGKAQKYYVLEDLESDLSMSDSPSS